MLTTKNKFTTKRRFSPPEKDFRNQKKFSSQKKSPPKKKNTTKNMFLQSKKGSYLPKNFYHQKKVFDEMRDTVTNGYPANVRTHTTSITRPSTSTPNSAHFLPTKSHHTTSKCNQTSQDLHTHHRSGGQSDLTETVNVVKTSWGQTSRATRHSCLTSLVTPRGTATPHSSHHPARASHRCCRVIELDSGAEK